MKYIDIVALAKKCVYNVEKRHTANVDNTRNYTTNAYIFSKSLLSCGKNVGVKKVPVNPAPQHSVIHGGIGIKNFLKLCQLMVNWVDKHNQAPAYLTFNTATKKYKIGIDTWAYATARVVTYYYEKKKLPNKVIVTSKIFDDEIKRKEEAERKAREEAEKKKREEEERKKREEEEKECHNPYRAVPFDDEEGCDSMGQNTGYYCGCSMLQKMFYRLGYHISQGEIAEVAGTTTDGTDHPGLETAIAYVGRKFGVRFDVTWYNFSELGFEGMGKFMCRKNTAVGNHILYRYEYGHYEYPLTVDTSEEIIWVVNSLGDRCGGSCYCGYVEERDWDVHRDYINGISQKSVLVITKV